MNNKKYLIALLVFCFALNAFSQRRMKGPDPNKAKAYKIAYITDVLDLSASEAQKFWPVYNEHEKIVADLRKQENAIFKKYIKSAEDIDSISESDAKEIVTSVQKIRAKIDDQSQELLNKMKKIIPYKKMLKLQVAERKFKRILLERLKNRRKKFRDE
jgi:hypothetical protein